MHAFANKDTVGDYSNERGAWVTIEDLIDDRELNAEVKIDDYTYGRFTVPSGMRYFELQSSRGVLRRKISELVFYSHNNRFQVLCRAASCASNASSPRNG